MKLFMQFLLTDLSRSCSQHGYRQAVGTTMKTNLISKSMHHTRGTLTLGQNNAIFPQSLNVNLAVNSSRAIHSNAGIIIPHMDKMTKASTNTLLRYDLYIIVLTYDMEDIYHGRRCYLFVTPLTTIILFLIVK